MSSSFPLSVLDLSPIVKGQSASQALANSLDLARHAEALGFNRYWFAEHHNMPGNASAATSVVIAHIAAGTKTIRVGSGGIMLPNHAPLVIAEQFGTLAALHPSRIDLGLGRASGSDQMTTRALRRDLAKYGDNFPQDVQELKFLLGDGQPGQLVRAVPGIGTKVPIWILGSSTYSAQLAAALGLPYAFAGHFAPDALFDALRLYRERFEPSDVFAKPYAMIGMGIFAADTDREAQRLFTSWQQQIVNLQRGTPAELPLPVDSMEAIWSPPERHMLEHTMRLAIVGAPDTVRRRLAAFIEDTGADEIIATAQIADHAARRRSYEILAQVRDTLVRETVPGADRPAAPDQAHAMAAR